MSLADIFPLRSTADWPGYSDARPIPVGFGVVSVELIPTNNTLKEFIILGHAISSVISVTNDGNNVVNYEWKNTKDKSGYPASIINFPAPMGVVKARVQSNIIGNPSRIMESVGGFSPLAEFRNETKGIELGLLIDGERTRRSLCDDIARAVGGVWGANVPGIARLLPGTGTAITTLTKTNCIDVQAESTLMDMYTRLVINFDGKSVVYTAPDAVKRYGTITKTMDLAALRSVRDAQKTAARLLSTHSRPLWRVTGIASGVTIRAGDVAAINHPHSPITFGLITGHSKDTQNPGDDFILMGSTGTAPGIKLESSSSEFTAGGDTVSLRISGDMALFTVLDDSGQPMAGALVSLDNGPPRISDAAGRVYFEPGNSGESYRIVISNSGFEDREIIGTWG